jgi:Recombination endonuclease VII
VKKCRTCKEEKPLSEFYSNSSYADGVSSECKTCSHARSRLWRLRNLQKSREYSRQWEAENKEKIKAYRKDFISRNLEHYRERCKRSDRKRKYGVTGQQFLSMKEAQGNRCAICGNTPSGKELCIDHCHATGKVRGLLCNHCNVVLGMAEDSVQILTEAIAYLQRTK